MQKMPQFADGGVDAVLGVDENFAGPEPLGDLGAGNKLTLARDKQDEQLHGLALHAQGLATVREFKTPAIEAEVGEFKDGTGCGLGYGNEQGTSCGGEYQTVWQETPRFERSWRFT